MLVAVVSLSSVQQETAFLLYVYLKSHFLFQKLKHPLTQYHTLYLVQ